MNISLGQRIAEESQLLAEEKWIISALNDIKTQRNCLQIERLQLESMKSQLKKMSNRDVEENSKAAASPKAPTTFSLSMAAPNALGATPDTPRTSSSCTAKVLSTPNTRLLEVEALCNSEELQLGVTNMFNQATDRFAMEEYEEEDEEEDNCEDLLLDMNMFMNCTQKQ